MRYRVKLQVEQKYIDIVLGKGMRKGDILETDGTRARLLLNLGYVSILEITKLSAEKNGDTKSPKRPTRKVH